MNLYDCPVCKRSGACHFCNGEGLVVLGDLYQTTCVVCEGSGNCWLCYGNGQVKVKDNVEAAWAEAVDDV